MAFGDKKFSGFREFLGETARGSCIELRTNAENFILEERLPGQRENNYGSYLENPLNEGNWQDCHGNYVEKKIYLERVEGKDPIPETFSDHNVPNFLERDEDQYLVRLETVGRLAEHLLAIPENALIDYCRKFINIRDEKKDSKEERIVKDFFYKWNKTRDLRPLFVGTWGEVNDIFDSGDGVTDGDWADRIRDRFGLGHLRPAADGAPIPVLLFRYRVGDVLKAVKKGGGKAPGSFAIPTVLDGNMSSYFCPTPENGWNEGQALDLSETDLHDYSMCCEILHHYIEYKPEHLFGAGWITRPPLKELEEARKIHMAWVGDEFRDGPPGKGTES